MTTYSYTINTTAAANTTADDWFGGYGNFSVEGTFGGGTVKLQFQPPGSTAWLEVDSTGTGATFTADGNTNFTLPPCQLRVNVTTGTTARDVRARIF